MMMRHGIDIGPGRALLSLAGEEWDEKIVRQMLDDVDAAAGMSC